MQGSQIDYRALFKALPGAIAVLTPDFVILDVNDDYLEAVGRKLEDLVGHDVFEVFPQNPADPGDAGPRELRASLEGVLASGERDVMTLTRYDVEDAGKQGEFEERYWAICNTPMRRDDGPVAMIALRADEVTHIVCDVRRLLASQ